MWASLPTTTQISKVVCKLFPHLSPYTQNSDSIQLVAYGSKQSLVVLGHEECVERKLCMSLRTCGGLPLKANAILVQLPAATTELVSTYMKDFSHGLLCPYIIYTFCRNFSTTMPCHAMPCEAMGWGSLSFHLACYCHNCTYVGCCAHIYIHTYLLQKFLHHHAMWDK